MDQAAITNRQCVDDIAALEPIMVDLEAILRTAQRGAQDVVIFCPGKRRAIKFTISWREWLAIVRLLRRAGLGSGGLSS